jgi:hypothetical protein
MTGTMQARSIWTVGRRRMITLSSSTQKASCDVRHGHDTPGSCPVRHRSIKLPEGPGLEGFQHYQERDCARRFSGIPSTSGLGCQRLLSRSISYGEILQIKIRVNLGGETAETDRLTHEDGYALGLHLVHNLNSVALHGSRTYAETPCDGMARESLHDQVENLGFATRQ